MSLSSVELIEDSVQRSTYGYSTVDTMGSLVGNRKFREGYDDFTNGIHSSQSYIWEALSAISQNLGQELYSNVIHYIDNVSNVDVCRIKSLRSMLQLVGVNYLMLDKIQFYPLEIQHLIDIFSINKKYLLNNEFIKQSFIDDLLASNAILLSNDVDASALEVGNISSRIDRYIYDNNVFNNYLSNTFYNFIYDMMDMYIVPDDQISILNKQMDIEQLPNMSYENFKAYSQIQLSDGYGSNYAIETDKYISQKKILNVDIRFDVEDEVDKIEIGQRSVDEYFGDELSLILEEIDYRKSIVTQISSETFASMAIRNAYYRKKKVIEYAKFVDSLAGIDANISSYQTYAYDPSYYLNIDLNKNNEYALSGVGTEYVGINASKIKQAARNLVAICNYANKVREVIRYQVRKVFMKGTNNLLEYTINEFLVDYANQLEQVFPKEQVSAIISRLSSHSIDNVKVQEYWDNTEYYNISCVTSNRYATNYKTVNARYFDETFKRSGDILIPEENNVFTNDEINTFYLSSLVIKNDLEYAISNTMFKGASGLSSNFYDFLSVLFDIAADPSYYDSEYNVFGSKLSNQIITHDIHNDLLLLKQVSAVVMSAATKANFEFTGMSSINQQKDALFDKLGSVLQTEYLSAVSAVYDEYDPQIQQISADFDAEKDKLSICLNQTYSHYFCKSTNSYSYNENGDYKFDYFIGNSNYLTDDYYILQLNQASSWIIEHCHTYPLSNAIQQLSNEYDGIKTSIYNGLVNSIQLCGFIDLGLDDLSEEMDSIKSFLNEKINDRTAYLQQTLANFRAQAEQLKTTYDSYATSFQQVLASMPDTTQGWYMTWTPGGAWSQSTGIPKSNADEYIYDQYSSGMFHQVERNGKFSKSSFKSSNNIDTNKPLIVNVGRAKARIAECKNIYYGTATNKLTTASSRSYGTQEQALDAILANLTKLGSQIDSILNQVKDIYQIDSSSADFTSLYVGNSSSAEIDYHAKILALIEYLGTKIDEAAFSQDVILYSYNSYFKELTRISGVYIPARNEYEVLWSKFSQFLQDFEKTSDYKVFKPENINRLEKYRKDKDFTALAEILDYFDQLYASYQSLVDRFIAICEDKIELHRTMYTTYIYEYTGDVLEECLYDFVECLVRDITCKEEIGSKNVDDELEYVASQIDIVTNGERSSGKVGLYKKYFPTELVPLSASYSEYEAVFDSQYIAFTSILDKLMDLLEYTRYGSFSESRMMFKNYTGITAKTISSEQLIADDPYYNHKNLTHPSYQIHPFLWNFTEKTFVQQAIDSVSKVFANIDVENLEGSLILKNIDSYIGRFGQLIDVWKNHAKDFTSYSTRYERSDHVCRYTNIYNEMVDYDGAFYPPALSTFMNIIDLSEDKIWNSMSKFYQHLKLDNDISSTKRIKTWLKTNSYDISAIAISKPIDETYDDIFKYQIDSYGNMYILYKRYDYSSGEPTYNEKLNTPGRLWVRLCDSPIAFPLSSVIDVENCSKYDYYVNGNEHRFLSLSECKVYDFEIIPSGKKICLAFEDPSTKQILCWPLYIEYDRTNNCGIGTIRLIDSNLGSTSNDQSNCFPSRIINQSTVNADERGISTAMFNKYIGMFATTSTKVFAFYATYNGILNDDGTILSSKFDIPDYPKITRYVVDANDTHIDDSSIYNINLSNIVSKYPAMSYYVGSDAHQYIDFAFVVEQLSDRVSIKRKNENISVNLSVDSEGYAYDDIMHNEMNSFDVFNQRVEIINIDMTMLNEDLQPPTKIISYQTNADMGYIPSYAGLSASGPLDIVEEVDQCHQAVELLGKSKDIDGLIDMINDQADPYMTMEDIYEKHLFGRVWENGVVPNDYFSIDKDTSLVILTNTASFYQNMPKLGDAYSSDTQCNIHTSYSYDLNDKAFIWNIQLDQRYSENDLSNLKVFMYNTKTLGKNPYIIRDISSIIADQNGNEYASAKYNDADAYAQNDYEIVLDNYSLRIAGTCNGVDEVDMNFSNHIDNIKSVSYRYRETNNGVKKFLDIKMELDDADKPIFIDKNTLKLALVDVYNMEFYEWFHLLDEGTTREDVITELGRLTGTPFTKNELLAIDLSEYNALSDVQVNGHRILDTYRKMSFKLDESEIFRLSSLNYYVPSLNIKYPLTIANVYDRNYIQNNIDADMLIRIFKQDEVYVLNVQDSNDLSSIEKLIFQNNFFDAIDDVRVYEDYLEYDSEYEQHIMDKYPLEDPLFYQYAHFAGKDINCGGSSSDGINVPDTSWKNIAVSHKNDDDSFSQFLNEKHLCALHSGELIDNSYIASTFEWDMLTAEQKDDVISYASKFLRLYMNYKKSNDGIVLYVNYQNFINSPFITLKNGMTYSDTIEGTYAKIAPDSSETINVVLQFRQYANGKLANYQNIVAATYQIFNISDDKPKFIIKKLNDISIDSAIENRENKIYVVASKVEKPSTEVGSGWFEYSVYAQGSNASPLDANVECIVAYQSNALMLDTVDGICVKIADGTLKFTFSSANSSYKVRFKKASNFDQKYLNKYIPVNIVDVQTDSEMQVETEDGYVHIY